MSFPYERDTYPGIECFQETMYKYLQTARIVLISLFLCTAITSKGIAQILDNNFDDHDGQLYYLAQKSGVLVVFFNIEKEEAEGYLSSLRLISHKHRIRRSEHPDLPIFFTRYYCGDD